MATAILAIGTEPFSGSRTRKDMPLKLMREGSNRVASVLAATQGTGKQDSDTQMVSSPLQPQQLQFLCQSLTTVVRSLQTASRTCRTV